MKNNLLIIVLFTVVLLSGCEQEKSTEVAQKDQVYQSEQSATSETAEVDIAPLSSEGLSLVDTRVGIEPARLEIPKLNVDAVITEVERIENGQMGVPENIDDVGWFEPGIKPGAQGNAVMAGHIDSRTGPAVFYELEKLEKGDEIFVHGKDDEAIRFIVTQMEVYPRNDSPVKDIFGFNYSSGLTLITCTGEFNRKAKTHEERFVVYTELSE